MKKLKEKIENLLNEKLENMGIKRRQITIEIPKNKENGDYSSNIAMQLCKELGKNPRELATEIINNINEDFINKVEIAGPGFINFYVKSINIF